MRMKIKLLLLICSIMFITTFTSAINANSSEHKESTVHKKAIVFEKKGETVLTIIYTVRD